MKIFFSYPHDDNAKLVNRIKADLEARGHELWFDASEIKEGDEWRNKITRGILDSQAVVAFLSKHSVRDPGVCLNEIAIALAEKGDDALVTVLVEPEKQVSAPISITHIQWLRMEDWKDNADKEGWYSTRLDKLIQIIEHPASTTRNEELETLRTALDPLSFNADIAQHLRDFTGRRWLFDRYTTWLGTAGASRVLRIEGGPGLGKTAFVSHLAHTTKSSVLAVFLCQYNRSESRNPLRLIQTLAYQLATRLPDYRARLLKVPAIARPELMDGKNAGDLWANLIAEPLSGVGKGLMDRQQMSIVIDGLDEATQNGQNTIVKLLAEQLRSLPSWIGLALTGRPDPEIVQCLSAFKPEVINGDDPRNLDDLKTYIDGWLATEIKAGRLMPTQTMATTKVLLDKSEGAFLYLIKAREAAAEGALDLTRPNELPLGLNEIYLRFFERRFTDVTNQTSIWLRQVKPLLALVLVSPEPLPLEFARQLLGWDSATDGDEQEAKALRSLGSLITQRITAVGTNLSLFHNSTREWLQNAPLAGDYFVGTRNGLITLTTAVWQRYRERQEQDHYGWMVLPELLPKLGIQVPQVLEQLLGTPEWETSQVLLRLADSLSSKLRFSEAAALFQVQLAYSMRLANAAPENANYARNLSISFNELGDLQVALGNAQIALGYYQSSLDIRQRLADAAPENANYARNLSVSFDNLGDLQVALGNAQIALNYYQRSLDIRQRLAEASPENADYARNLSVSFERLGNMQLTLGSALIALGYYQSSLGIRQRLADTAPENADYARSLSISFNKLGDLQVALGNAQIALGYYQQSHDIFQRLADAAPENADYARNLSVSFDRLGDLQVTLGSAQIALGYYQRSLDIRQRLADAAPENAEYAYNLSVSVERLGNLQVALGNAQIALGYYQQSHDILQRLADAAPENADYARNLSISFNKLGNLQVALGNAQIALGYYQQSHDIIQRLADAAPENADYARNLSISLNKLGDLQVALGNAQIALGYYQQSHDIFQRLADAAPENADYARNLSISFNKLGDLQVALGNAQIALGYYQQSHDIFQRLADAAPENANYAHNLSASFDRLGNLHETLGNAQIALGYYQRSYNIIQRLADAAPENADYARTLSASFDRLGNLQVTLGNAQIALGYYQRSLDIRQHLADAAPENADYARNLSVSFDKLGDLQVALGNAQIALNYYQRSLDIRQRLAEASPENADYARNLSVSFERLGGLQQALGNAQIALNYYQNSLDIRQHLANATPENVGYVRDLAVAYYQMALSTEGETSTAWWHNCYEQFATMSQRGILDAADEQYLEYAKQQLDKINS